MRKNCYLLTHLSLKTEKRALIKLNVYQGVHPAVPLTTVTLRNILSDRHSQQGQVLKSPRVLALKDSDDVTYL